MSTCMVLQDARFGPSRYRAGLLPASPPEAESSLHSCGEVVAMGFIHCLTPLLCPSAGLPDSYPQTRPVTSSADLIIPFPIS